MTKTNISSLIGKVIKIKSYKGAIRNEIAFVEKKLNDQVINVQIFAIENNKKVIKHRSFFVDQLNFEEIK